MSVRAYRVITIEKENDPSFNLWHDEKLMKLLEYEGFYDTMVEGSGLADIPVEVIEKAIKNADEFDLDKETVEKLKEDVTYAKKFDDEYIQYYCY